MSHDLRDARSGEYKAWDARLSAETAMLRWALYHAAPGVMPEPTGRDDVTYPLLDAAAAYVAAWLEWESARDRLNALENQAEADAPRI